MSISVVVAEFPLSVDEFSRHTGHQLMQVLALPSHLFPPLPQRALIGAPREQAAHARLTAFHQPDALVQRRVQLVDVVVPQEHLQQQCYGLQFSRPYNCGLTSRFLRDSVPFRSDGVERSSR